MVWESKELPSTEFRSRAHAGETTRQPPRWRYRRRRLEPHARYSGTWAVNPALVTGGVEDLLSWLTPRGLRGVDVHEHGTALRISWIVVGDLGAISAGRWVEGIMPVAETGFGFPDCSGLLLHVFAEIFVHHEFYRASYSHPCSRRQLNNCRGPLRAVKSG